MMTLKKLQQTLRTEGIPALLVTRNNMFLDEDILPEENKIMALTGFSGSAGILLVMADSCYLFVDGRYKIQAREETDSQQVRVIDCKGSMLKAVAELCKNEGITDIAYNAWCLSFYDVNLLQTYGLKLENREDLVEAALSSSPVKCFAHETKYSGKSNRQKCQEIGRMIPIEADALLICSANLVSWLVNMRSETLPDTPILRAYALLTTFGSVKVFADNCNDTAIRPLKELAGELAKYRGKTVVADEKSTPQKILDYIPEGVNFKTVSYNFLALAQIQKNQVELEGFKNAHIRDGVAVTKFLCRLDENWQNMTEKDVVAQLHDFRKQQPLFFSESFATIAATGAHAAIVHYQPTEQTNIPLQADSVLLLDSGGQYFDGTTDVTRTIALGNPPTAIIDSFTQVLKAHLALFSQTFPDGTPGCMLDAVARSVLWRFGKDYAHGTGHGVGHFSNVHEGPFAISSANKMPVRKNYVISNEPGYYEEGKYGIRIENLVYTVPHTSEKYLAFRNLTLVPIDKRLINVYLLDEGEKALLNNYHDQVWNCLAPYMNCHEKEWLKKACSPL